VVATQWVSLDAKSVMGIDIGKGSSLNLTVTGNSTWTIGSTTVTNGTLTNNGTVRLLAGAGVTAGKQPAPITAATWNGSGTFQAIGGTWDNVNHVFTASAVLSGTAGQQVTINNLENEQRVLISDSATGWSVGASFLSSTAPKSLTLTATTISGDELTALESQLGAQQSLLGGWDFAFTTGYADGDPAYLSFDVGSGYSRNALEVWHFDDSSWTQYSADDLTYDGTYASFTTVPEPGALGLLVSAGLGRLAYARRRGTVPFGAAHVG
jgi:hypothetical protein